MRRTAPFLAVGLILTGLVLLGGCRDGSRSDTAAATDNGAGASAGSDDPRSTPVMRDRRYCEVLLVSVASGSPVATVYNSYPLNECPPEAWTGLDAASIASQFGVALAVLNGPRHWMIDHVEKVGGGALEKADFGGIEMYRQATVPIGSLIDQAKPYSPYPVARSSIFYYSAGTQVFELTGPGGEVYVMQSFSQQKDPTLRLDVLPELGTRLSLPPGWSYGSRTLTDELALETVARPAQVVQDDLGNSYSLIPTSPE